MLRLCLMRCTLGFALPRVAHKSTLMSWQIWLFTVKHWEVELLMGLSVGLATSCAVPIQKKPLRVAYVIGTFAAMPLLVGAMNRFLKWVTARDTINEYNRLRKDVAEWVDDTNNRLEKEFPKATPPLALAAYSSVWTMIYKRPGRYHWILQYYLKDEGLNLSWVGTGRLSFSLDFTREDLDKITEKIVRACHRMEQDGWWWVSEGKSSAKFSIQLNLIKEILRALAKRFLGV
mmetsp:Transcript_22269/g.48424  ORF Transcript_22269/g.48424 Transcript_22269/m.48424 type:complete len:232 (+) Transcript_22269:1350-2045(+)